MQTTRSFAAVTFAYLASLLLLGGSFVIAQDTSAQKPAVSSEALSSVAAGSTQGGAPSTVGEVGKGVGKVAFPGKTILDDPATSDPRLVIPVDAEGGARAARLSKIDLDGDFNYDGTISNEDPSNQGRLEYVPPGLELGVGEVTRLVIRLKTYEESFPGKLNVTLDVTAINRESASGSFASGADGQSGRVKVWRDQARTDLLLDSGDSSKLSRTWTYDSSKVSSGIPRVVYVEGVEVSPKAEGDIRLLVVSEHVADGASGGTNSALYRPAFDHLLLTVRKEGVAKEFVNNNAEAVWSTTKVQETGKPQENPAETGEVAQ
jgi:hypothetical protein